jgi:phosphoglycolate phosphatase
MNSLFFDLDGTLTDPRDGIVRCLQYALEELGRASPPEVELTRYIGPPLYESFPILLRTVDPSLVQRAVKLYRQRFAAEGIFENELYPGITAALAVLQTKGHTLYVVTSKPTVFARQIIEHFDLRSYFQRVYGSDLDGARSDKAQLIAHVLAREHIRPADATMIGDREHDIKGALANGVCAIGVLWGYGSREELMQAGASVLLEAPAQMTKHFC